MEFVMFEDVDGMEVFVNPAGDLGQRVSRRNYGDQLRTR